MTPKGQKYLFDMGRAIAHIESYLTDTPTFEAYQTDSKTRSAVERQLAIVGEAANHFRRVEPTILLPNTQQMVDFRNHLIHAYDDVNDKIVWAIVHNHLPALKADIIQRLAQSGDNK